MRIKKLEKPMIRNWGLQDKMKLEELIGKTELKDISGKPFGINPYLRYDESEFKKRAGELFAIESSARKLMQNSGDIGSIDQIAEIAIQYMPGVKERNREILKDPRVVLDQANSLLQAGHTNMAKYVASNYRTMLGRFSDKALTELALELPDRKRKYQELEVALARKDIKAAKAAYVASFKTEGWKKFIASCPEVLLKPFMIKYVKNQRDKFSNTTLSDEKKNKLKTEYVPNRAKTLAYIDSLIASAKEKERDNIYMGITWRLYGSLGDKSNKTGPLELYKPEEFDFEEDQFLEAA